MYLYALYHPEEGVTIPLNLDTEPQMQYPLMFHVALEASKDGPDFLERLKQFIHLENPKAEEAEFGLLLTDELAGRLDKVVRYELQDDYLCMLFDQMKEGSTPNGAIRAAAMLREFTRHCGKQNILSRMVLPTTDKMKSLQDQYIITMRSQNTTPELTDFLHNFLVDLASPDSFQQVIDHLLLPRLSTQELLQESLRFVAINDVAIVACVPWWCTFAGAAIRDEQAFARGSRRRRWRRATQAARRPRGAVRLPNPAAAHLDRVPRCLRICTRDEASEKIPEDGERDHSLLSPKRA